MKRSIVIIFIILLLIAGTITAASKLPYGSTDENEQSKIVFLELIYNVVLVLQISCLVMAVHQAATGRQTAL
jgi:hypothetical protein